VVQGLLNLISGLHAQLFKVAHFLRRHDELCPATNEIFDFGAVTEQGPIFVEGDLIEFELLTQV